MINEKEGDFVVTWSDRDYKSFKKVFKNDPKGSPENARSKATLFADKLNSQDRKSPYGLYRSVSVGNFKESIKMRPKNNSILTLASILEGTGPDGLTPVQDQIDYRTYEDIARRMNDEANSNAVLDRAIINEWMGHLMNGRSLNGLRRTLKSHMADYSNLPDAASRSMYETFKALLGALMFSDLQGHMGNLSTYSPGNRGPS